MKYLKYFLTGLQIVLGLVWIIGGLGGQGFDFTKFNFLPIPNFGDILMFIIIGAVIYGIQKLKYKLGVGEDINLN